jgi:hypothetical protein
MPLVRENSLLYEVIKVSTVDGQSLTVDGNAYRTTATITRPSNTTAYTAGDVVGDTGGSAIISLTAAGPTNSLFGTIKRLTYWPQRLANSTLQTLTQ